MSNTVIVVFGTRPEAIKMLPVLKQLRAENFCNVLSVSTGQHKQMLEQVLRIFDEKVDVNLDVMTQNQSLAELTAKILGEFTKLLVKVQPSLVLVHGDTTTAMAAALACFYAKIPIGHVEAGLRSRDYSQPWPEELNRVFIDSIAKQLYAPTAQARRNLCDEKSVLGEVYVTGNTGIDALFYAEAKLSGAASQLEKFSFLLNDKRTILVTGHRRENLGEGFRSICNALLELANRPDVQIVYPVHLNPAVRATVTGMLESSDNIHLIDPVSYIEMVFLMKNAHLILTDSGGIQEEAPALGKPVLVLRDVTERPEAVAAGVVKIIGTKKDVIVEETNLLLDDDEVYKGMARNISPYGDGTSSKKIAKIIRETL
ncbi:non-hydrolyzing UDP-N-acetylglucosamine 2-epimerase [Ensifer sp.]|uniref:non-hydrolyzing UDP-N-acetylglucosamine 2-epimerase n=1 Tax=Ensifer sp. TaxID=1872086 RepID=UPI0028A2C991|nr:UDP-N-acetylglucosamine 2-epimerase (non-hydrolyzing) [Ensifer sp.]